MNATGFYNIILVPAIAMLFFVHFNFKPNKLLTSVNEYLLFKKYLFNKKIDVPVSKKIACSFFYFFSVLFISSSSYDYLRELVFWRDSDSIDNICFDIVFTLVFFLIIRLIYEFLIIPYLYKKSAQNMHQTDIPCTNNIVHQKASNSTISDFKFCSQCGTRYPVNDIACPKCGKN